MKRKLIILVSMASPLLIVALCLTALLLAGLGGWLLLGSSEQARVIRIAPLAPLNLPGPSTAERGGVETPAAAPKAPAPGSPGEPSPLTGSQPVAPPVSPLSPADVEEVLGFPLPDGSVNSITQEGVATRLVIPKLNLDAPVVVSPIKDQTWQVDHLGQAIGHLEGTAPPGSNSNVVLAGHVTLSEGVYGPFAGLGQLNEGDLLVIYEGDQKFNYVIDGYQIVERTAIDVTYPSQTGQVTLITCNNWNRGTNRYEQRLVVKGHLIDG